MQTRITTRVIIYKDSKVLLSKNRGDNFWYPGGGKWEDNETLEECCKREVMEEKSQNIISIIATRIRKKAEVLKRIAGFKGEIGTLFWLYSFYIFFVLFFIFFTILRAFLNASGLKKAQLRFILIGIIIWIVIVLTVSFVLPMIGNFDWTSFDSPSSLIFIAFTAYAVVKYRFLDIRAIIFRTIAFGFILLLITAVFSVVSTLISKLFTDLVGTTSNIIAGLVIALLVTLFYQPMRRVVERVTNTFLYKKSYDPDALLSAINETTSSILNLDELLNKVSRILSDAFHCEKIGVALLNGKKKLKVTYKDGFKPGVAEALVSFPNVVKIMFKQFKETPGIFVIDERKTQYDNGEFRPVSPKLLYALFESDLALIVPLYVKEKLLGVLVIGTKKSGDPYPSRDINILNIISGQFAIAIDRAQLYGHLEELVAERTEKLKEVNKKLASANIELKKIDQSKSDFISIASHQLRTPLTAIKGWISMINDGDLGRVTEKFKRILKKMLLTFIFKYDKYRAGRQDGLGASMLVL